ncbi:MAG: MFS transporter [Clostridia bacterium]
MKKLSLKTKLIYSLGNLGIAIITTPHMLNLVYFFFPPDNSGLPILVPQNNILFGLTVLGIILTIGRVFDAAIDPSIASLSDKMNRPSGKRIPWMRFSAIPFALCYLLVFFVPVSSGISIMNVVWLFAFLVLSAIFFSFYIINYNTLMVEIAQSSAEKVDLSTISSAFWFVGFVLVSFTSGLWQPIADLFNVSLLWGVRLTYSLTSIVGVIFLLIPAFAINEKEHVTKSIEYKHQKLIPAFKGVMANKSFGKFLLTNTLYTISTYIFESGLIYFITVLALLNKSVQGTLTTVIGVLTLAFYPLINILSKKGGKKKVMIISLISFTFTFIIISALGKFGINVYIMLGLVVLLSPFAQASFGILPNVITADCAAYDRVKYNEDKAGMYVAVNSFITKLGGSISAIVLTSFLTLGKNVGNDSGIRYAVLFAAGLSIIGMFAMLKYNEKDIMSYPIYKQKKKRKS